MNKVLYIILISLFSFTVISCSKKSSTSDGTTAPVIVEVTPVPNQISNSVPEYTFSSTKGGTITYEAPMFIWGLERGYCSGGRGGLSQYERTSSATVGINTINLYGIYIRSISVEGFFRNWTLQDGTYSNCKIIVTDAIGNASNTLTITPFTVGSGVFVAVGNSGTIVRSTDNGTTWDNATSPTANNLKGVTYGPWLPGNTHKGNYVAVGSSGNIVATDYISSDSSSNCLTNQGVSPQDEGVICDIGSSFDNATNYSGTNDLQRVAFGNNTFVAVGGSGNIVRSDAGGSYYSHNLISFDNVTSPITSNLRGITFGNNIFVAVGRYGKIVRSSDNGTSFDNATSTTANTLRRITFGNNTFVAVGDGGNIVRSTDNGSSFDNVTSPTANDLYDVGFGKNTFVAVGTNGNILRSTDDGITWDNVTSPTANDLNGITYGNYSFVAVGDGGNIVRSMDYGSTWDNITSGTSNNLNGVTF